VGLEGQGERGKLLQGVCDMMLSMDVMMRLCNSKQTYCSKEATTNVNNNTLGSLRYLQMSLW
jgi:hypothetical protein